MKILLKEYLQERKITYRAAEEATGIAKSTLQEIASGKHDPRLSTLERIAEGLNCKISDFVTSKYLK